MILNIYNTNSLQLLKIGGAVTGNSERLSLKYFKNKRSLGVSKDIILISSFLKNNLSSIEYQAICYHEEAHYVLKHNISSSLDWKIKELQADAYASKKIGAQLFAKSK